MAFQVYVLLFYFVIINLMITQQVVTYIKDQLARGTAREKIRSNLISAGWVESDIDQAFSFAEPAGQNAALKIAPAFAVPDEVRVEKPVDKTEISKPQNEAMPILKRDNPKPIEPNLNTFSSGAAAINAEAAQGITSPAASVGTNPISVVDPKPIEPVMPAGPTAVMPTISPLSSSPIVSSVNPASPTGMQSDVRTFNSPVVNTIQKPASTGGSPVLKFIAFVLFLLLIIGNAYLWLIVFPASNKINTPIAMPVENSNITPNDQITRETVPTENIVGTGTNPTLFLETQAKQIHSAASAYFSKYNTYGGTSMPLGSCSASGTVFSDTFIKNALSELSNITGRVPQCALASDENPSANIRTISYIVYIPMEDAGYCIDSTGAAIVVSKIPNGLNCASGL